MNIGIIGVGKLGLSYALVFEKQGLAVYASSYKQEYVEELQRRHTDTVEPKVKELLESATNITFTVDNHEVIHNCNVIYAMVATPSLPEGDYDISALQQVVDDFLNHDGNVQGKILIVGSTANPGNCDQIQQQLATVGVDVVYCPTFAAQGSVVHDIQHPIGLLLGTRNNNVANKVAEIFNYIIPEDTLSITVHPTTAEILKLASNCYSTLRISYFNQVGQMLISSGVGEDIELANQYLNSVDRRKGNLKFGFGFGGPCYPRDNRSFNHYAQKIGSEYAFGTVIDKFNNDHSKFIGAWLREQNTQQLPYFFDYISYKPGVTIIEESQQYQVCENLLVSGAQVYIQSDKFLLQSTQDKLTQRFGNKVLFVDKQDLDQLGIFVYHVNL